LQFFHGTHGGIGCAHAAGVGYDEYRQDFVCDSSGNNPVFFPTTARELTSVLPGNLHLCEPFYFATDASCIGT